jgi:[ribosomal protein S18]-alanine N-acetyltransferase
MANLELIRFELARERDAQAIATLAREVIETGLQPAWVPARVLRRIYDADCAVVIARDEVNALAGFAIMRFGDDAAHLDLLAVDIAWRRRGLGRRLVHWLEESARTAGTFLITLEVRADNPSGVAFYQSLGYSELSRVTGYYEGKIDAIQMRHDLAVPLN